MLFYKQGEHMSAPYAPITRQEEQFDYWMQQLQAALQGLSSTLPAGGATADKQDIGNTSLSTIATNTGRIPTVGQKVSASSSPVVLASDQSTLPASLASLLAGEDLTNNVLGILQKPVVGSQYAPG